MIKKILVNKIDQKLITWVDYTEDRPNGIYTANYDIDGSFKDECIYAGSNEINIFELDDSTFPADIWPQKYWYRNGGFELDESWEPYKTPEEKLQETEQMLQDAIALLREAGLM